MSGVKGKRERNVLSSGWLPKCVQKPETEFILSLLCRWQGHSTWDVTGRLTGCTAETRIRVEQLDQHSNMWCRGPRLWLNMLCLNAHSPFLHLIWSMRDQWRDVIQGKAGWVFRIWDELWGWLQGCLQLGKMYNYGLWLYTCPGAWPEGRGPVSRLFRTAHCGKDAQDSLTTEADLEKLAILSLSFLKNHGCKGS